MGFLTHHEVHNQDHRLYSLARIQEGGKASSKFEVIDTRDSHSMNIRYKESYQGVKEIMSSSVNSVKCGVKTPGPANTQSKM